LTSDMALEGVKVRGKESNIGGAVSACLTVALEDDGTAREDPFLGFAKRESEKVGDGSVK
jgi:hypothetical protein